MEDFEINEDGTLLRSSGIASNNFSRVNCVPSLSTPMNAPLGSTLTVNGQNLIYNGATWMAPPPGSVPWEQRDQSAIPIGYFMNDFIFTHPLVKNKTINSQIANMLFEVKSDIALEILEKFELDSYVAIFTRKQHISDNDYSTKYTETFDEMAIQLKELVGIKSVNYSYFNTSNSSICMVLSSDTNKNLLKMIFGKSLVFCELATDVFLNDREKLFKPGYTLDYNFC